MSENIINKKIYAFGSRWSAKLPSYLEKCIEEKFAFAGVSEKFKEVLIKQGDIILLKFGENIKAVGMVSKEAQKPHLFSEVNTYFTDEEIEKYQIERTCNALFVKVDKWIKCDIAYVMGGFHRMKTISPRNNKRLPEIYSLLGINSNVSMDYTNFYKDKLLKSKNLILTGAPGTGKTYLAKKIAESIVLDGVDAEEIKDKKYIIIKNQIEFVQFHPSYDYTDFVEGIKPTKDKGFEIQDGIFKKFCKRAVEEVSLIDDCESVTDNTAEYDNALEKCLKEFVDKLAQEANEENPIKIYGFKGGEISPIIRASYDDKKIYFTVTGKQTTVEQEREITYKKFTEAYKNFIKYDIYKYNSDLFVKEVKFWFAYSSYYGFLRKFYEENNSKLPQIKQKEIKHKKYVFIIDEINRGDLNKILGELFYAVDPGYRGEKGTVSTQYKTLLEDNDLFKEGFYIPENVYIIGTMNDIDRSIESMDFAIRRRFAWQEITYDMTCDDILSQLENKEYIQPAKDKLNAINAKITELLGDEYNIGASYFLKLNECDDFEELWESYLYGILFEYFRSYSKIEREEYLKEFESIVVNN